MTYDDLYRGSARNAAAYRHKRVAPREIVLVALPHSPDLLYAFFGAMMAGCVPSFIPPPTIKQDPSLYWSSHRKLFERIGTGAIVTWRGNAEDVRRSLGELPIAMWLREDVAAETKEGEAYGDEAEALWIDRGMAAGADIAFLQHSSGTTGLKKGVALSFDAVDRWLRALIAWE